MLEVSIHQETQTINADVVFHLIHDLIFNPTIYHKVYITPFNETLDQYGLLKMPPVFYCKEEYFCKGLLRFGIQVKVVTYPNDPSRVVVTTMPYDANIERYLDILYGEVYEDDMTPYATLLLHEAPFKYKQLDLKWCEIYMPEATHINDQIHTTLNVTSLKPIDITCDKRPGVIEYLYRFEPTFYNDYLANTWNGTYTRSWGNVFDEKHPWLVSKLVHRSPYDGMSDEDLGHVFDMALRHLSE